MSTPETTAVEDIEEIQRILQPVFPQVNVDGDIGKITRSAVKALVDRGTIREVQKILARKEVVDVDGVVGDQTMLALYRLDSLGDTETLAAHVPTREAAVKASFFAGPQDVRAFRKCKDLGGSDVHCFAKGDNGVGRWGEDCTRVDHPMAALPREVWQHAGKGKDAPLWVEYKGVRKDGVLGDTMPSLENVHNGAGIDLNPGFAVAFGIDPQEMNNHTLEGVSWGWL